MKILELDNRNSRKILNFRLYSTEKIENVYKKQVTRIIVYVFNSLNFL